MKARRVIVTVCALFVAALTALFVGGMVLWQDRRAIVELPVPAGPHSVGRVRFDWTDDDRVDPIAPDSGTPRELPVWIWYPADASQAPLAPHATLAQRAAMRRANGGLFKLFDTLVRTDAARVRGHALDAPPLATEPARFPLLLLKPGRGASAADYSVLAEDLASRGHVVVGSDSPHTTGLVAYLDGRVVTRSATGAPPEYDRGPPNELTPGHPNDFGLPVLDVWVADFGFLLDRLATLDLAGPGAIFADRLDLVRVGVFGHSFGGAAALQFCSLDARCAAVVDLDGLPMGTVMRTGIDVPFMFVASDRPVLRAPRAELDDDARAFFTAFDRVRTGLPNDRDLLVREGTAHWNFSDAALLTAPGMARLFGQLGPIGARRGLELSTRYLAAFFDTHLRGLTDAMVEGPHPSYPEARWLPRP